MKEKEECNKLNSLKMVIRVKFELQLRRF